MQDHPGQRLHQLQLACKHRVDHLLTGQYRSIFKGQGLEFDEVRAYSPGDDVRTIDWNVTARSGDVHIKRFHEEREINLIFVVDNSPSFAWSSQERNRKDVAAEMCSLMGTAAVSSNDRIGLMLFSDGIDSFLQPARGQNQLMRCLERVLSEPGQVEATSANEALEHLSQMRLKRSIIVVISDFLMGGYGYVENLAVLGQRHEVIAIAVDDPREQAINEGGLMRLKDAESGQTRWLDLASKPLQKMFRQNMDKRLQERQQQFALWGLDLLVHQVGADPVETLLSYFSSRRERIEGETGG